MREDAAQEKVLDRIRKLTAMSRDASSPEEAGMAAAEVQRLILKYGISAQSLGDKPGVEERSAHGPHVKREWFQILLYGVARSCMCHSWLDRNADGSMTGHFAGREPNVAACSALLSWLRLEMQRLCDREFAVMRAALPPGGAAWKTAFLRGAASTICRRLREDLPEAEKESSRDEAGNVSPGAIVLLRTYREENEKDIGEWLARRGIIVKAGRVASTFRGDTDGFVTGLRAGQEVELNTPKKRLQSRRR